MLLAVLFCLCSVSLVAMAAAGVPHRCFKALPGSNEFSCKPQQSDAELDTLDYTLMTCKNVFYGNNITLNAPFRKSQPTEIPLPLVTSKHTLTMIGTCRLDISAVDVRQDLCEWRCYGVRSARRVLLCVVDTRPGKWHKFVRVSHAIARCSLLSCHMAQQVLL